MAEYSSMVTQGNYEIHFQTKNYDEYREMQETAREIIDRNSTVLTRDEAERSKLNDTERIC